MVFWVNWGICEEKMRDFRLNGGFAKTLIFGINGGFAKRKRVLFGLNGGFVKRKYVFST